MGSEIVMRIPYWRYSATGNTFLIFDNREGDLHEFSRELYGQWAQNQSVDGLLFLERPNKEGHDFHMRYLNADGQEAEMCGNGARSIIHFAGSICKIRPRGKAFTFSTLCATYSGENSEEKGFPIVMSEVGEFDTIDINGLYPAAQSSFYLFTGVPHCCFEVEDLEEIDIILHGREVRHNPQFNKGSNVNFFKINSIGQIHMRTYERGVEAETLSCGTGATATALCIARDRSWESPVQVRVPGGLLQISFTKDFKEVTLSGKVDFLGESHFDLPQEKA